MNILYVDHYAGSPSLGMEFRPHYLAREWVRQGHAVRIVGASYSHVRIRQPAPTRGSPAHEDGIEYEWLETPRYRGNGVGRAWNIFVFLARTWFSAGRLVRETRPDVVIASSTYPMDIWVARRIARLSGARLVFELHDVWPASPIELGGMSPRHPFVLLCARAEAVACRDADVYVSILPNVAEYLASRGLDLAKLHVVGNGVDPAEWACDPAPLADPVERRISQAHAAGRIVVGYAGAHGAPNALDTLLDAAKLLRGEPFDFLLVGDGHEKTRLEERARREGLHNVTFFAPIAKAQMPTLLSRVDVAYIGLRREPLFRFGIAPNKLMDYMMAGCAIVQAIDAPNDLVSSTGCGLTVMPESAEAVAAALRTLGAYPSAARRAMGARGRAYMLANHTWPVLAQRFLDAVREPKRA